MNHYLKQIIITLLVSAGFVQAAEPVDNSWTRPYNPIWDAQSADSTDSMPVGGGNLGLNVWVENNDLLFTIGHPDSRIENGQLVKLGRVRMTLTPSPFTRKFRQRLSLAESCIRVSGEGEDGKPVTVKLWVDAFNPVIHAELEAGKPLAVAIAYESWRFQAKPIADGLEWIHRNDPAIQDLRQEEIKRQGGEAFAEQVPNLLNGLTMGGRIVAAGLVADGTAAGTYHKQPFKAWKLKTATPVNALDLRILIRVEQDAATTVWQTELDTLELATRTTTTADLVRTLMWWKGFWRRSHIIINADARPDNKGWQVGRNYQLFRYLLACNRTGKTPTLFNGGIFTCEANPDNRMWWECMFMAQNQRLLYWPMLKAGDFDMMRPGLDFYRDRAVLGQARAKSYWGIDGMIFPESLSLFGLHTNGTFGDPEKVTDCFNRCPDAKREMPGHSGLKHLEYHYTSSLEFAYMMLEWQRFTGRDLQDFLPVIAGVVSYYDQYYRQAFKRRHNGEDLDINHHLVIDPSCALELYAGAKNNADVIAGLMALTDGLLALPNEMLSPEKRLWVTRIRDILPPLPMRETRGHQVIAPAESWQLEGNQGNMEFPQMYAVFPFSIYGLGKPDLEIAKNTWLHGYKSQTQKDYFCWFQGGIDTARLGMVAEARQYAQKKFLHPSSGRFPAFWSNPGFCQTPDMDHGGCAMIGLQEMLMQTPGDKILLFPAWQADWDVSFKLYAPRQTIVECELRRGQIENLKVTPESRRKDIQILGPAPAPEPSVSQGKRATASSLWYEPGYDPGNAVDGDDKTRWAAANGARSGWLEVDLGEATLVSRAVIKEISWPSVSRFAIEAQQRDGQWKAVATGTIIGAQLELKFPTVKAQKFRLNIQAASNMPNIEEFQLFTK
jgi:hypothetical protein